jgi:sensor domain CHASE-containing protein
MSKNTYQKPSPQTQEEAIKLAKAIQRPAQTKEQTKLIALGIQKGIELYKKQQKEKARELSKRLKKASAQKPGTEDADENEIAHIIIYRHHWLPWVLLVVSWLGMVIYLQV